MKKRVWIIAALVWLAGVALAFASGFIGVGIDAPTWLPEKFALAIVALLFNLILFGWTIPLAIGIYRLLAAKQARDENAQVRE